MSEAFADPPPGGAPARSLRLESPAGPLLLRETGGAITRLHWMRPTSSSEERKSGDGSPLLAEAARQLEAYFAGKRRDFDLPLAPAGSTFHKAAWRLLCAIPFGQTATYGDLARQLESAAQPVGAACGANPIAILIPCHRVVAADGLGGFSGGAGVESKRFLLHHEGALEPELDLF
ncbi:MAG TPA: methylated-DNA--[protein]-cysteine S-methyltransferase [Thermohalobaculum sp.]|nr:methylated-DNA--[protein]-cysteine S-methyltransferase [Thermohalobaculum sp.]